MLKRWLGNEFPTDRLQINGYTLERNYGVGGGIGCCVKSVSHSPAWKHCNHVNKELSFIWTIKNENQINQKSNQNLLTREDKTSKKTLLWIEIQVYIKPQTISTRYTISPTKGHDWRIWSYRVEFGKCLYFNRQGIDCLRYVNWLHFLTEGITDLWFVILFNFIRTFTNQLVLLHITLIDLFFVSQTLGR